MRRFILLFLVVAMSALVFAPVAVAQDDNPSRDDMGFDDRGGHGRGFDDNPGADDVASPAPGSSAMSTSTATSTATPTATATATTSAPSGATKGATKLPKTGGPALVAPLALAAAIVLAGTGAGALRLVRQQSTKA